MRGFITKPVQSTQSPSIEGDPMLLLVPADDAMTLNVTGAPGSGRTIVDWEVQRYIASVWTTVTAPRVATASEVPARRTTTPTKWVHPSGTLDGNGAYTTIQAALNAAVPGDEIVIGSATYNESPVMTVSGTAIAPIVIRAFDYDSPPLVDGQSGTNPPGWGSATGDAHLFAIEADYVTLDGIRVENSSELGIGIGDCTNNGYFISDSATWYVGLKIIRCVVKNIEGIGITMLMTDGALIAGCDFSECQRGTYWDHAAGNPAGWGYAVQLSGRSPSFLENVVRETMGEGIHVGHHNAFLSGPSRALGCTGFTIRGNTIYDCWSAPIYYAACEDGTVERNLIYMSDDDRFWYDRDNTAGYPQYCMAFGSELGAFGNPTQTFDMSYVGCQVIVIRNNIINGANRLFQFASFAGSGGIANYKDIDIDHNTIYATKGSYASIYEALRNSMSSATDEMTGVRIRNNTVLVSDASDISITWNSLGSGKVVQGNVWSHSPPADLAGTGDITDSGTVIDDKTYSLTGVNWPSTKTFDATTAVPPVGSSAVNAVTSIGTAVDYYGYSRPTHTGNMDAGAISLSMENSSQRAETGLANATSYDYRVRYRMDDGSWSGYSATKTATTL